MTTPAALMPGWSPSSSAASRVMIATSRTGSVIVDLDPGQQPLDLHVADDAAEAVARAQHGWLSAPAEPLDLARPGTTRRLRASRRVRMRPSRSQRRSVSSRFPSARAASVAVYVCLGNA